MTTTPSTEPTLADVIKKIEELELTTKADIEKLSTKVDELSAKVEKSDERFADYRQATQWVVQLAFTLIASATITVIITSVFK